MTNKPTSPSTPLPDLIRLAFNLTALALAALVLLMSLLQVWHMVADTGADLIAPNGMPLGTDFISLWSAAWLAHTGNAAGAYDQATIFAAHHVAVPANTATTLWHYPPTFLLVLLPLGSLPYLTALAIFTLSTLLIYLLVLYRLRPHWSTLLFVLSYPAVWLNFLSGQNAFITATLLAGGLLAIDKPNQRRSLAGGLIWGLLSYKPQLGLLLPLALLARRRWAAMIGAGLSVLLFAGLSVAVLGVAPWQAFIANIPHPFRLLENSSLSLPRMVSTFSMVRMAGWDASYAYQAQALSTALATIFTLALWADTRTSARVRGASLGIAMLMATPHVFHYDLAILAVPLLLWLKEAESTRWLTGERALLAFSWLAPLILLPINEDYKIGLYPLLFIILQLGLLRRAARVPESPHV